MIVEDMDFVTYVQHLPTMYSNNFSDFQFWSQSDVKGYLCVRETKEEDGKPILVCIK